MPRRHSCRRFGSTLSVRVRIAGGQTHRDLRSGTAADGETAKDIIEDVLKSALWRSLTCCAVYLAIAILIAAVASSKGMCGDGYFRAPCSMFASGMAMYGALGIGATTTLVVLVGTVLGRRVSPLLKTSAILYGRALLSLLLPVRAAGNKLAGAIVVMAVLPISLGLLVSSSICVLLWAGHAWAQISGDTMASVAPRAQGLR